MGETQTFEHDDLLAADQRRIAWKQGGRRETLEERTFDYPGDLISFDFISRGARVVMLLTICIIMGTTSYICLAFSDARESKTFFAEWFATFKWIIAVAYVIFLWAMIEFYRFNHTAVDIAYPWYHGEDCYNVTTGVLTADPYISGYRQSFGGDFVSAALIATITWTPSVRMLSAPLQETAYRYMWITYVMIIVGIISVFALQTRVRRKTAASYKDSPADGFPAPVDSPTRAAGDALASIQQKLESTGLSVQGLRAIDDVTNLGKLQLLTEAGITNPADKLAVLQLIKNIGRDDEIATLSFR